MSWYNHYKQRVNSSYQEYFEKKYNPVLDLISILLPEHNNNIVEIGCGRGGGCGRHQLRCDIWPGYHERPRNTQCKVAIRQIGAVVGDPLRSKPYDLLPCRGAAAGESRNDKHHHDRYSGCHVGFPRGTFRWRGTGEEPASHE